eukprot:5727618-Ditylum_brightwellii.AAC.1
MAPCHGHGLQLNHVKPSSQAILYFGLHAAACVCNYMSIQTEDDLWSSPFEITYGVKSVPSIAPLQTVNPPNASVLAKKPK